MENSLGNNFTIIGKLGEGSFADVYKVRSTTNQSLFAVKRLKKKYRSINQVSQLPEVAWLKSLQGHENIVKLYDLSYDPKNGYVSIFVELLEMNLYELLKAKKSPIEESRALLVVYQLLSALAFMHEKNLFHRDVKPENCMINKSTLELKLVDFGSTRETKSNEVFTEYVSTRWYRAPECIMTSGSYGPKVDEWAVGCILYEILTSRPLFPGKHEIDQINKIHSIVGSPDRSILSQFQKNPNNQMTFNFPHKQPQDFHKLIPFASNETVDLITKLLKYDQSERLSASDALKHPAFRSLNSLHEQWAASAKSVCFSEFALTKMDSKSIDSGFLLPSSATNAASTTASATTTTASSIAAIDTISSTTTAKPIPINHVTIANKPIKVNKNSINASVIQTRLKAAKRIIEFNQSTWARKCKYQKNYCSNMGLYTFSKPPHMILPHQPPAILA